MSGPTREQALQMAREAGYPYANHTTPEREILERFAALAYAAGQAAECAKMPPAPMLVDSSRIDLDALVESLKHSKPMPLVAGTPRQDEIAAAVAAEREACANVCENVSEHNSDRDGKTELVYQCAAAIRARGQQ